MLLPASTAGDGLRWIDYGGTWEPYCSPAVANSTGVPGRISAHGTLLAGAQPFRLEAHDLPPHSMGLFLVSDAQALVQLPFSQGPLCLGGTVGRFTASATSTGSDGSLTYDVDLLALPLATPTAVQAGDTYFFQAWYRDMNPTATSNFTDAAAVDFR